MPVGDERIPFPAYDVEWRRLDSRGSPRLWQTQLSAQSAEGQPRSRGVCDAFLPQGEYDAAGNHDQAHS